MRLLEDVFQDLRFALRSWARQPGWLAAAVVSAGLGVGAATTVIGGVDRQLRRPPPGLELVLALTAEQGGAPLATTGAEYDALADASLVELAAYRTRAVNAGAAALERVSAAEVSPRFFGVAGAEPLLGRLPGAAGADSDARALVIAESFWRGRLGADPAVIGSALRVDGERRTIAAVLPGEFVFPATDVLLWLPLDAVEASAPLGLIARLRSGVGRAAAEAELNARLRAATGAGEAPALRLRPVPELYVTERLRVAARIGIATGVFVLLIACANVANLLLARGVGRTRELAVRRSLGASRGRLARQLLAESAVVAGLGCALGVLAAVWGGHGLMALWARLGDTRPFPPGGTIDGHTLAVALAATAAATLLFGLGPALHAARTAPAGLLGGGRGAPADPRTGRTQRALMVAQLALALALVSSAALLTHSFLRIQRAELGFRTADLVTFRVGFENAAVGSGLEARLLERLRALPGVTAAGAAESLPLDGAGRRVQYRLAGTPGDAEWNAPLRVVTPDYFEALDIPLVRGRALDARDLAGAPPVAVVNRAFAARHQAGAAEPGGALLIAGAAFEIVGVAENTREWGPHADGPAMIYVNAAQLPPASELAFVVHSDRAAGALAASVRAIVASIDRGAVVHELASGTDRLRQNTARSELLARVMAIFAGVALLLAIAGVHATMAHATLRRVSELAVRRALGATSLGILRLVLRQGLSLVLAGVALGALIALGAARVLAGFLVDVGPADLLALAAAAAALGLVALLACLGPAWRAARVAPLQALTEGEGR